MCALPIPYRNAGAVADSGASVQMRRRDQPPTSAASTKLAAGVAAVRRKCLRDHARVRRVDTFLFVEFLVRTSDAS